MRPEVRALFPAHVIGVEACRPDEAEPLFPDEAAHIARAVDKRKLEYALGRTCARRALAELGIARGPLLSLPNRAVAWPKEAWGSITHATGYCAAVAARRSDVRGLGIDAEEKDRVHERLWKQIASESEIAYFRAGDALLRAALLFSAKETFYKAQFCVSEAWVGFHDAHVELDEQGGFELELLVDVGAFFTRGTRFAGKYCVLGEHVVTGMVI